MKHLIPAIVFILLVSVSIVAQQPAAQEDDEISRRLWDTGFMQQRPAGSAQKKSQVKYRRAAAKRTAGGAGSGAAKNSDKTASAMLGITIWRLRPSVAADNRDARILVQEEGVTRETSFTPERIEADTAIAEGQRVRLSIESPTTGYLYVVDREQYADGSLGEPYLIFPTLRTRGGDNAVTAGRIIEIPAQEDSPSYFKLEKSRSDHIAETISLIVTPEPIAEVEIQRNAQKLTPAQLVAWEKQWKVDTVRLEQVGTAGQVWTKVEKEAGADGRRKLTQEDPAPQTLYRLKAKPGAAVMVNLELKIRK